jgi:hypothetical protein
MSAEQEQNFLAAERAEGISEFSREEAAQTPHDILYNKVMALKADLPRLTFGYIGNYEYGQDHTTWYIFLPHFGRVGTYSDSVYVGEGRDTDKFTKALANWDKLEVVVRRQYAADPDRIERLTLRDGRLYHSNGTLSKYSTPNNQFYSFKPFANEAEAEAWLDSYQYPATVKV